VDTVTFIDSPLFTWVILPSLIFLARVCDVTIGTVRIMLLTKGRKILAPMLGFIEVLIWLLAIRQIFNHLTNVACYLAFAGGFAMGNYVGMYIEEKLAIGLDVIRIITRKDAGELVNYLKDEGYGVTKLDATGTMGKVNVIFTIVNRKEVGKVVKIINKFNPKAFYSVEEIRAVNEGVFPPCESGLKNSLRSFRKGKEG